MIKKNYIYLFLNIILLLILLLLSSRFIQLKHANDAVFSNKVITQKKNGVSYTIIKGTHQESVMIIGDLLGINFISAQMLKKGYSNKNFDGTQIIVSQLNNTSIRRPAPKNFFDLISTERGIVLADNFCTKTWDIIKNKEMYLNTTLSPGPYCFSEPQTVLIDKLLKQHVIAKVYIYYDTSAYLKLIKNFLTYLEESGISYILIDSSKLIEEQTWA